MIKLYEEPNLKQPYLITAWPGMGNVAFKTTDFLRVSLKAKLFAELDSAAFFVFNDIYVENGIIKLPQLPYGRLYYCNNPELILFISNSQPPGEKCYSYAVEIIKFVSKYNIKLLFTFAAMPVPIDHLQKPEVWSTATTNDLLQWVQKYNIKLMSSGQISGLNGLILGVAKEYNIDGVCLLGELPLYMIHMENPKTALYLLRIFTEMLSIKIDLAKLEQESKAIEQEVEKLFDYFNLPRPTTTLTNDEAKRIQEILSSKTKIPPSVRKNIEQLFKEAEKDINKANELKQELDKWDLYKEYEDRFLDLFSKGNKH